MNNADKSYLELLKEVRENGVLKSDRTGTGTVSIFGRSLKFKMSEGFPLLTTKKIHTKSVIHELLWFLDGGHNIKYLVDNGVNIWNEWPWQNYMKEHENRKLQLSISIKNSDSYRGTPFDVANMKERLDKHPPLTIEQFVEKIKTDDSFAQEWGELGPVYGKQWRKWQGWMRYEQEGETGTKSGFGSLWYDQILRLVENLKTNPDSRRLMVNAWNVAEIDSMLLPPCHYGFQCWTRELTYSERVDFTVNKGIFPPEYVSKVKLANGQDGLYTSANNQDKIVEWMDSNSIPKRSLSLMWQQRSVDLFLGLPFNIASYGLLLEMLAQSTNMVADELIFNGGDCHIYSNHFNQVDEQLKREPMELCKLELTKPDSQYSSLHGNNGHIIEYKYENFKFIGYKSHPAIKAPIAI